MKRFSGLATLLAAFGLIGQPAAAQGLESPRLRALQDAVGARTANAVEAFWQEMAARTTPLIERTDEHQTYALVTFLWRGDVKTSSVFVGGGLGQLSGTRAVDNLMTRLGDTDVWYRSYWLRKNTRTAYAYGLNVSLDAAGELRPPGPNESPGTPQVDLLNPKKFLTSNEDGPPLTLSMLEMPDAQKEPWLTPSPAAKPGQLERHEFTSPSLKNTRQITVYLPPGYQNNAAPYPLLLMTDGAAYTSSIPAPVILDNIIGAGRVPPLVAVLIGNVPGARSRELGCYEPFLNSLVKEVLPWVRGKYQVTTDRTRTVIAGSSLGGLTAACAALAYPEVFGSVLSQSGSFWWKPAGDAEGEWVGRQLATRPKIPVRWYVSVGSLETDTPRTLSRDWQSRTTVPYQPTMLVVNQHLRDILNAKGYDVEYAEVGGAHNGLNWRGTLGDAILALFGAAAPPAR